MLKNVAAESGPDFTKWRSVAAIPNEGILVGRVGQDRVFAWRKGDLFRAYGAVCPHLGGPVDEGLITNGAIRCPWHHACFDLMSGAAKAAPAFDALTRYPVEIRKEQFALGTALPSSPTLSAASANPSQGVMAIVGGGAAGFAAADSLRREGWAGEIVVFSNELDEPYDRTLVTKDYLDGHFGEDRLPIARHTLKSIGAKFEGGVRVQNIDVASKRLRLSDGGTQPYFKLLLATGATPRKVDLPGADLPHVVALRSLADCRRIIAGLASRPRVAVVGGSFIALEVAASLRSRDLSVEVIAPEQRPMEKIFGSALSDLILDAHRQKGVGLHLGSKVARIEDDRLVLQDGDRVRADLVVLGVGVEPQLELAQHAGLKLDRGVAVDSRLETSAKDIFAAGDIARWPDPRSGRNIRIEHWVVAERQRQVAAANMLGIDRPLRDGPILLDKAF
jgi:apoptosis-inducing factor 3